MQSDRQQLLTRTLFASLVFSAATLVAREYNGPPPPSPPPGHIKAAGCAPSTTVATLWVNNVRTLIETGGNMWENRAEGAAAYEVPATEDGSGASALFAGALWMGGFSPDNQLKLAAVRFRQVGNDYWPGPLTNTGDASITPEICTAWDRVWTAGKQDAIEHDAYFTCLQTPGCDVGTLFPDGYQAPNYFFEWPAIGDIALFQDQYIAPFVDFDGDGDYDPTAGDAPDYGLHEGNLDCKNKFREDPVTLFGDSTMWWVFNDKGNAHTESGGQPIGMEIRAQAFAFATNNEVNNMTFYNYVLINQGTQTLQNTYFGQWVDADLGYHLDDYVGCDVQRGLGYCYNGDNDDESSADGPGYGIQPPAVGVDFFEGPFLDYDEIDNPLTTDCDSARTYNGIPYKGIGIGYGDGVVDNERYGMRAFLYHNNDGTVTGDPSVAIQYYNYLRAIWKDGSFNYYGGTGHVNGGADEDVRASYMFPGDSDPLGWGTNCVPQTLWTEETESNDPADRRFIQSAGPFTLEPGAYNNITVGVVWARANTGGPFESVNRVRQADDKAQALFDNCFKILNGPDAPLVSITELDRELILTLSNPVGSNNFNETYNELDPTITEDAPDRYYRFPGYQLYQLRDADVSVADIRNPDGSINVIVARPVLTCDVEDGVDQLVNYIYNDVIGLPVPVEMVNGPDLGVVHSISIKEDKFSNTGDPRLVNFKTYYFMALAYGYNNYQAYNAVELTGQAFPYIAGRKSATGAIRAVKGIPHKNSPQTGGTVLNSAYGSQFNITRVEGQGNGGLILDLEPSSVDAVLASPVHRMDQVTYKKGFGPVDVKVINPLVVPSAQFELWLLDSTTVPTYDIYTYNRLNDAYWKLIKVDGEPSDDDTVYSSQAILVRDERLIPDWGISVAMVQQPYTDNNDFTEFLGASITFADPNKAWFTGIPDQEGETMLNWIRSGTVVLEAGVLFPDRIGNDPEEEYEGVLNGTWAPWPLMADTGLQPCAASVTNTLNLSDISLTTSTLVVLTNDRSKWTRCAVLEIQEITGIANGVQKLYLRDTPSRDKNGLKPGDSGYNDSEGNVNGAQPTGMSWFPGYAIDLETGERLNMAFGEDYFWGGTLGRDMIWNPTDQIETILGQVVMAGGHWIYVFRNENRQSNQANRMTQYDKGQYLYDNLYEGNGSKRTRVFRAVNWVGSAACAPGWSLYDENGAYRIPTEVRIRLNVNNPYLNYMEPIAGYVPAIPTPPTTFRNNGMPLYTFSSATQAVQVQQLSVAETACDLIDIVPNPYYAYSGYETGRLDNRVKFINLPQQCTISIYNVSGTLIRKFRKDNTLTYLDWDLKNQVNVPVAGGLYICHIDVPGVCERVVKWFGVMRPVDLQNF